MKISYLPYTLTPRKKANAKSSGEKKKGVLLCGELKGEKYFADFFPHEELGDESLEEFLENFKFQKSEYERRVFDLLLKDPSFQRIRSKDFLNHSFNPSSPQSVPLKIKIMGQDDFSFVKTLKDKRRVRLDANGIFSNAEFKKFFSFIDPSLTGFIDYIEDPSFENDWQDLPLKKAQDFIQGSPYDYLIYKVNARFLKETTAPVIYSSYMGGALGNFHAYCELILNGDLSLFHGIDTFGFYEEDKKLFQGEGNLSPDPMAIKSIYNELHAAKWRTLCSM